MTVFGFTICAGCATLVAALSAFAWQYRKPLREVRLSFLTYIVGTLLDMWIRARYTPNEEDTVDMEKDHDRN